MASLQEIRNQVTTRLKEIAAEVAALESERTALTKVADTLGDTSSVSTARNGRRRTTRRRASSTQSARRASAAAGTTTPSAPTPRAAGTTARRRNAAKRRSSGGGRRAEQTVQIIGQRPGITVKEIAAELGIKPNYLYRVLPTLEKEGKVTKQGTGYMPVAGS